LFAHLIRGGRDGSDPARWIVAPFGLKATTAPSSTLDRDQAGLPRGAKIARLTSSMPQRCEILTGGNDRISIPGVVHKLTLRRQDMLSNAIEGGTDF